MILRIGIKGVFMKKRLLSILLGLIVVLGIVGCSFYPEPEYFVGEWQGFALMTFNIYADYTWTYGQSIWVFERGTWIHNGDNTITLINEDNNEEIIAEYHSDRIYEKDEEGNVIGTWAYTVEKYLLIDGTKYYKE